MEPRFLPLSTNFGIVRHARPSDGPQLVQMVGYLAEHHGDTSTLTLDDLKRDLFNDNPWISVVVAEKDDRLIGYAAMCALIQLQFGARGMDMHHLFTDASFRGQGVGRSLVEACKIDAITKSCRYLAVGTHPENRDVLRSSMCHLGSNVEMRIRHASRFDLLKKCLKGLEPKLGPFRKRPFGRLPFNPTGSH